MKKLLIVLMLCFLTACSDEPYLDPTSDYVNDNPFLEMKEDTVITENRYYLDLRLDESTDKLYVTGQIIYVNDEMDFDELYLKIFANASYVNSGINNVEFEYLKVNDVEYDVQYSGYDHTTIHLNIEETLSMNENFTIDFKYEFDYWDDGRLAVYDDVYYTMFFYPYVAMYDQDTGWQTDEYTFRGESYYNEIGDYFVSLLVPSNYEVAASGKILEVLDEGDNERYNMYLNNGRDFSFSTSARYHIYHEEIDGISHSIYSLEPLSVSQKQESFDYLRYSFEVYEEYVGEYYYDYFNLEYGYIYGMESSGVIYCSSEISEYTVVHEVIHQWFYSMIGNDQSNYSFIDESLTTYTTFIYFLERYDGAWANGYLDFRSSLKPELADRYVLYEGESLIQQVNDFGDGYAYLIYYHGPTIFRYYFDEMVEDTDYTVLKEFLTDYYNSYHGKEVTLDEFLALLEETTGIENTVEWFELMIDSLGDLERRP